LIRHATRTTSKRIFGGGSNACWRQSA